MVCLQKDKSSLIQGQKNEEWLLLYLRWFLKVSKCLWKLKSLDYSKLIKSAWNAKKKTWTNSGGNTCNQNFKRQRHEQAWRKGITGYLSVYITSKQYQTIIGTPYNVPLALRHSVPPAHRNKEVMMAGVFCKERPTFSERLFILDERQLISVCW